MKSIYLFLIFIIYTSVSAQKQKLHLCTKEFSDYTNEYYYLNKKNDTIIKLNRGEFNWVYSDSIQYFFTGFDTKLKKFVGRNLKNKYLFELYVGPEFDFDNLQENRIRITDSTELIGFANEKGKVIIKPQFYIATRFSNGYAIFGKECKKEDWEKEKHDSDCNHYSIVCKIHGVINRNGKIIEEGNFTFEELMKKYNWKSEFN
jgi:hypothetical protein